MMAIRPSLCLLLVVAFFPLAWQGSVPRQMLNVAAADNGGVAIAAFSQDTFHPEYAIDGEATTLRGWAFHGQIHRANIIFGFDELCNISRARVLSGIGMSDHHIREFEIWAFDSSSSSGADAPAGELRDSMQVAELSVSVMEELVNDRRWRRVRGIRGLGEGLKVVEERDPAHSRSRGAAEKGDDDAQFSSRVKVSTGVSDAEILFEAVQTIALKLVVHDADSPFQNAVLNEFEAWGYKLHPHDGATATTSAATKTPPATATTQAAQTSAGAGVAGLGIRIVHPAHGASVERAELQIEVGGVEIGPGTACIFIFMDGEEVALVTDLSGPSIILDRDRRIRPWGLTWHRVLVDLRDAQMQRFGVQDWVKFRLVGPRQATPGPGLSLDGTLSSLQAVRRRFPELSPRVCAGFMSCGRLALLRMTLKAFVAHMERSEPDVTYEIAWVDQGSGPDAHNVPREVPIEHPLLWRVNYGVTYGLNTLLFALCRRSRFAMTMEEDWLWREERDVVPAIAMAIQVMESDSKVVGVFLRSVVQYKVETSEPGPWQWTDGDRPVEYRRMCQKGGRWGAWTNGAAIWDREKLEAEVGRLNEQWGDASEQEYATRVGRVFCAAQIRTEENCDFSDCNAVAVHVGSDRTPGWAPEIEYMAVPTHSPQARVFGILILNCWQGNGQYQCMSYGKPVDKDICDKWVKHK